MTHVIIDDKLLNLHNDTSKGLISGLKRLQERGISISLNETTVISGPVLQRIFELEDIKFSSVDFNKIDNLFLITNRKNVNGKGKKIFVGKKTKNKTIADAVDFILTQTRSVTHERNTKEAKIKVQLNLDGKGKYNIKTGVGFFDHMLEQISKHSNIDIKLNAKGDLHIDEHHTVEDTGITVGEAILKALGNKRGIKRFGSLLPMDDSVAQFAIDLSGRTYLNYRVKYQRNEVGEFPTELVAEFFKGLSQGLNANIYIRAVGKNDHHKIEAIFKAAARALNEAVRIDPRSNSALPSTKGKL